MRARFLVWPAVVALLVLDRALARLRARAEPARSRARALGRRPEPRGRDAGLARSWPCSARCSSSGSPRSASASAHACGPSGSRRGCACAGSGCERSASTSPARFAFAMFESYLHWRAGIGFHGLSCLVGPVHRNAIPLLAALALAAASNGIAFRCTGPTRRRGRGSRARPASAGTTRTSRRRTSVTKSATARKASRRSRSRGAMRPGHARAAPSAASQTTSTDTSTASPPRPASRPRGSARRRELLKSARASGCARGHRRASARSGRAGPRRPATTGGALSSHVQRKRGGDDPAAVTELEEQPPRPRDRRRAPTFSRPAAGRPTTFRAAEHHSCSRASRPQTWVWK